MITAELIKEKIGGFAADNGLEIIDIRITKFDEITLVVSAPGRNVTLDDCVLVNRRFTEVFDQDEEDYSLVVTSPGVKGDDALAGIEDAPEEDE